MAYPVIEGTSSGVTSYGTSLAITLPSSIVNDEYIIGFVSSEVNANCTGIASSSGNFYVTSSVVDAYSHIYLTCFIGKGLGSGSDNITLSFSNSTYASYIVYRISGHGMESQLDFNWNYGGTVYNSSDFPMKGLAVTDSGDKLYLTALAYSKGYTTLNAPSGWGSLIEYAYNGTESDGRCGIATASVQTTSTVVIDNTWVYTTHETQTSVSITTRVKPGSYPGAAAGGIGVIVPSGRIGMA